MLHEKPSDAIEYISIYQKICFMLIWMMFIYACIIQYKYLEIHNGMLMFGLAILLTFLLSINGKELNLDAIFSRECVLTLIFMGYMFIIGFFVSPNLKAHLSQWLNCLEYFFVMLVIVSLLKVTGSDTFQYLLLFTTISLGLILLYEPVQYVVDRYSISKEVNPNGLGMSFVAGIWATLFLQQKGKLPLLLTFPILALFGYCIIQTGSRKSIIGAMIVSILWLFFCFLPNLKRKNYVMRFIYFALIIVFIYLFVNLFMDQYSGSTMEWRMSRLKDEATEGERYQLYMFGWKLLRQNPLFGLGFTGYQFYNGQYSHATFVEIPVSGGILGSVLYFLSYGISINRCIQILLISKDRKECTLEFIETKMILVLWGAMLFFSSCIIHPYQFLSAVLFGIIFGKTVYLENQVYSKIRSGGAMKQRNINHEHSKYIKD